MDDRAYAKEQVYDEPVEREMSPLDSSLNQLAREIGEARDTVERLCNRLNPVRRPALEKLGATPTGNLGVAPKEAQSDIINKLQDLINQTRLVHITANQAMHELEI